MSQWDRVLEWKMQIFFIIFFFEQFHDVFHSEAVKYCKLSQI